MKGFGPLELFIGKVFSYENYEKKKAAHNFDKEAHHNANQSTQFCR